MCVYFFIDFGKKCKSAFMARIVLVYLFLVLILLRCVCIFFTLFAHAIVKTINKLVGYRLET